MTSASPGSERTAQMQHTDQQGPSRRAMLRAGAATGTAAALGAAGLFAAGTASAATTAGTGTGRGLPYPPGVTDTSHCTPEVAEIFRGFFAAKSEHDVPRLMSYFSRANT